MWIVAFSLLHPHLYLFVWTVAHSLSAIPFHYFAWLSCGVEARDLVNMIFAEITAMGQFKGRLLMLGPHSACFSSLVRPVSVIRKEADECVMRTIAKEGRKFGVGLLLAAQTLDDLSEDVFVNSDTHFALPNKSAKDARKVEQKMNLRREALNLGSCRWLVYYQSGFGLYKANFYYLK